MILKRVLRRGSEQGVSRRCLEHPLGEHDPLGVRPKSARHQPVVQAQILVVQAVLSGTKNEPKPKLSSPDIFWWGRGLPHEGVGAKKFGMSLETRGIKIFWRDFAGIPWSPKLLPQKNYLFRIT